MNDTQVTINVDSKQWRRFQFLARNAGPQYDDGFLLNGPSLTQDLARKISRATTQDDRECYARVIWEVFEAVVEVAIEPLQMNKCPRCGRDLKDLLATEECSECGELIFSWSKP